MAKRIEKKTFTFFIHKWLMCCVNTHTHTQNGQKIVQHIIIDMDFSLLFFCFLSDFNGFKQTKFFQNFFLPPINYYVVDNNADDDIFDFQFMDLI